MKKLIIYLPIIVLLLSACDDFLEQEPGTKISFTEQLSSYEGVQQIISGIYRKLYDIHSDDKLAVYADLCGGNLKFSPDPKGDDIGTLGIPQIIENIYSFNDQADDSDLKITYEDCYEAINSINILLENIDVVPDASETEIDQVKAECFTLRAFTHFILMRVYSQNFSFTPDASHPGIIYNLHTQKIGIDFPERKTCQECYRFMMDDLEQALLLYTDNTILPGPSYSMFNSVSARALAARVALYANQWQKAYDYANDAIGLSDVHLLNTDNYVSSWQEPNVPVSEILFELAIPIDNEGNTPQSNTVFAQFGYDEAPNYKDYVASMDLLNLFEPNDVRGMTMFIEANIATLEHESLIDYPYYFTYKFQDNPGYPVLRLSEQYLIRAEAAVRLGDVEQGLSDLNSIRINRDATLANEGSDLIEEIFIERRKELCFEGHFLFDIARYHKNVERIDGCLSSTCNLSYPSNYFVLPIPDGNLELNSNLIQNEGY